MITFTPLQIRHFPLLLRWLEKSHVKAWWDQDIRWTPALIEQKYGSYVQGVKRFQRSDCLIEKPINAFIIGYNNQDIGYMQYYNKHDFPLEEDFIPPDLPTSLAAIDLYIGEENYTGKGIGPKVLELFLTQHVFKKFDVCFIDIDIQNTAAKRCYEKAGFRPIHAVLKGRILWMMKEKR